jgi:4-amino-4-deoxy-L-arabinose transferase-like glycosyltransferase
VACAPLVFAALLVDWQSLMINGLKATLNDQVGYITIARHWIDNGRLDGSIIYPSLLEQNFKRNSFYMEGSYAELALTFRLIGYSAVTARLPALISFVVSCGLVYWIAAKLFGSQTGVYSVALFAFFPLNLIYAFTAMAEIPLAAAGLAAFAIFVAVPENFQWWLGPLTLALPVIFRETGIIIALVMCSMLFVRQNVVWKNPQVILSGLLSCAVLLGTVLSPLGAGRPSLWKANILGHGSFDAVYNDAFALAKVQPSLRDWVTAIGFDFASNVFWLFRDFGKDRLETASLLFLLSGVFLGAYQWRKKRDGFALGVAAAVAVLFMADLCVYTIWNYRGIRTLGLMQPFVAILWAARGAKWTGDRARKAAALVTILLIAGLGWTSLFLIRQRKLAERAREDTAFLESAVGTSKLLVVGPYTTSIDYVIEHYPQEWAFRPANCETMRLLHSRHPIGTLIVPVDSNSLPDASTCGIGLTFAGERSLRGVQYWVFRK